MAIVVVQSKSGAGASLSFTTPTTAGNCVVVVVCDSKAGSVVTATAATLGGSADNFGASAVLTAGGASASNAMASFWVDKNCTGGQTAVAATLTNQTDPVMFIYELSGIDPSSPLDLAVGAATTSSSSFSSGSSGTSAVANEIFIGAVCVRLGLGTVGTVSGFTNLNQTGASSVKGEAGYVIVAATTSQTYTSTISTSAPHAAGILSLKQGSPAAKPTTQAVPFGLVAPYPMNIVAGSYVYSVQNPANIPSIIFAEPNIAAVTVTAPTGSGQANYTSSPQFPLHLLQSVPQYLRLSVFAVTPPSSPKAGAAVQGLSAAVNITAVTGSEAVNYASVQQFPFPLNSPWPLPVIAPRVKPQRQNQPRFTVPGVTATVTVTAQTGSATPNVTGEFSTVAVSAKLGTQFARINYAVPFPFKNYPYPLNIISNLRPQNPASKPGTYVAGLTAYVNTQANFGISSALYYITPQFPFTNLALPLPLRRLRQQNFAATPQHVFSGIASVVTVRSNFGTVSASPHGNVSAVAVAARTGVTKIVVTEAAAHVSVVSFAKTTISVRGNVSADTVTARFGRIVLSVSSHGSVTVTPRTGSPKITVTGAPSAVRSASTARVTISPHGNVSSVTAASSVHISTSASIGTAVLSVLARTGTPNITINQVNKGAVNIKAYVEGVAFTGLLAHATVLARFGSISVVKAVSPGSVAVKSYIGSAGMDKSFGNLVPLHWSAKLVDPVVN